MFSCQFEGLGGLLSIPRSEEYNEGAGQPTKASPKSQQKSVLNSKTKLTKSVVFIVVAKICEAINCA